MLKFCLFHCVFCLFVELLFEKCTGGTGEGWARVGGLKGILSVDRNDIQRFLDFVLLCFSPDDLSVCHCSLGLS